MVQDISDEPLHVNLSEYVFAKTDRLTTKTDFCVWQESPFSLLEELEAKQQTLLLMYPWTILGIAVQMSYMEGCWQQNWGHIRPTDHFTKNGDHLLFITKEAVTENIQCEIFPRGSNHGIVTRAEKSKSLIRWKRRKGGKRRKRRIWLCN